MKVNKKIDIKSVSTVFGLLVLVVCVVFGLSFYKNNSSLNLDSKDNLANSIDAAKNVFQQYSTLPNLDGLSEDEKRVIRAQIDEAINNLDIAMIDVHKQIYEIDPKVKVFQDQIRAIDTEIATMSEGLKEKNSRVAVFINSASIAERTYIQKKSECERLLNITSKQKAAKNKCNTEATKLKTALDVAVAKINSERNKLPALESQKITADSNYATKVAACGKLLNTTAAQKKAKTACNTQATNLKKIADDLAVQIEAEKKYAVIEASIKQKQEEKTPINNKAMELYQQQNYLRTIRDSAQTIKDQLTPLKERFKETQPVKQPKPGCMDLTAKNFDEYATENDGTCDYGGEEEKRTTPVCDIESAENYDSYVDTASGEYADTTVCKFKPVVDDPIDVNPGDPIEPGGECEPCKPSKDSELSKPIKINAQVTHFGGPNDKTPGRNEKAAVTGENMKDLDTEGKYYVAWPLKEGQRAFDMPNITSCLGEEEGTEKGNEKLNKFFKEKVSVIVSRTDDAGYERTFVAEVVDRGPAGADRLGTSKKFDMSRALYRALHIEEDTAKRAQAGNASPWFDLELKFIPKGGSCKPTFDNPDSGYQY